VTPVGETRRRPETGIAVIRPPFSPPAERRSVLDRAHRGDIEGALGRIRSFDTGPRLSIRRRLATLLVIMGPGLVVMVADNDAGGLSVYAQAGQNSGLALLWPLLLLAPVLFVNQEMVARLGAVTGAGHARLIFERFGRRWGAFALADLLALNLLTIVTELIGVSLALGYFGVSRDISVPLAALALVVVTSTGSFRRWERTVYLLVAVNLVAVPLALWSHPRSGAVAQAVVPGLKGGVNANGVLFVIALVGTTVAPWQLFFQQSNVVDKRITARWLGYARVDTLIGTLLFTLGAVAVLVACATAFDGTALHGAYTDTGAVAHGLERRLGAPAGALFALLLLNASILGAGVVTLATSYAVGDVSGVKHSLHRGWRDARVFQGTFAAFVALAAAAVLLPGVPLGIVTTAVQALAGVLLPSASVLLLLLCNDRAVLGPWTNPRWLNALATVVVGVLLVLSALLTLTTLLPGVDVTAAAISLAAALAAVLAVLALASALRRHGVEQFPGTPWERSTWTMPRLETLAPPALSRARTLGLVVLRVYLAIAALLLVVKVVQLAIAA
jgi:NRAMP (natural resistance-associated macrophage protein)-like metal ion transporter